MEDYYTILLLVSYVMWSSALGSPDLLLSHVLIWVISSGLSLYAYVSWFPYLPSSGALESQYLSSSIILYSSNIILIINYPIFFNKLPLMKVRRPFSGSVYSDDPDAAAELGGTAQRQGQGGDNGVSTWGGDSGLFNTETLGVTFGDNNNNTGASRGRSRGGSRGKPKSNLKCIYF